MIISKTEFEENFSASERKGLKKDRHDLVLLNDSETFSVANGCLVLLNAIAEDDWIYPDELSTTIRMEDLLRIYKTKY